MTGHDAAALAAIRAAFGESVGYAGGGLPAPDDLMVIWSDVAGDPFQGAGNTTRTITCEIEKALLPARPAAADRITRDGVAWKPIEVTDRADVAAWVITVGRA